MATKKTKPQDEKFDRVDFDLFGALESLDRKRYSAYSELTEEQAKKFTPYMLLHWMSAVSGNGLMPAYYVLSVDSLANKHMFNEYVQRHPELQWLMLCSSSPGAGKQFHQWIPHLSQAVINLRDKAKVADVETYLAKIYGGSSSDIKDAANTWTTVQNHEYRLAQACPSLKRSDISVLAQIVSSEELDEYEKLSGG
jgi:hypothetical protein